MIRRVCVTAIAGNVPPRSARAKFAVALIEPVVGCQDHVAGVVAAAQKVVKSVPFRGVVGKRHFVADRCDNDNRLVEPLEQQCERRRIRD